MRENLNVGTLTAGVNTQGTDCPVGYMGSNEGTTLKTVRSRLII